MEAARDAREQPTTHAALIAYFFDTEFNEMEYEIVKQRPLLTEDFFAFLKKTEAGFRMQGLRLSVLSIQGLGSGV